jgi:hypothetical protein
MADVRNILLKITGDPDDAQRALRETAAEIQAFARQSAEAEVKIDATEARRTLANLDARLTEIGSRKVEPEVKVNIDQARARLRVLRTELQRALQGGAGARPLGDITHDIAALGGGLERLFASGRRGNVLTRMFDSLGRSARSFVESLPQRIASGVGNFFQSIWDGAQRTLTALLALGPGSAVATVAILVRLLSSRR